MYHLRGETNTAVTEHYKDKLQSFAEVLEAETSQVWQL